MKEIDRVLVERACQRLITTYCHLVDHGEASGVPNLFTDDAVLHLFDQVARGRSELQAFFAGRQAMAGRMSRHVCNNALIDVIDDDNASAATYLTLYRNDGDPARQTSPAEAPVVVGEYRDTFVRTSLGWKFNRRELVVSFVRAAV